MGLYAPVGVLDPNDPDTALKSYFDRVMAGDANASYDPSTAVNTAGPDVSSDPIQVANSHPNLTSTPAPHRNFFQRIGDQPGGSKALLAFGQQMLSSPDFFSGLGNAGVAYQNALDEEHDKLKPQLTKDQQYQYQWNPTTKQYDFTETAAGARALQLAREKLTSSEKRTDMTSGRKLTGVQYAADTTDEFKRDELPYRDKWERERNVARVRAAELGGQFSLDRARIQAAATTNKPPPVGALKEFDTQAKNANTADATLEMGSSVMDDIDKGNLDLGLASNMRSKFSQTTGWGSNDNTRAYARWEQFQQVLVNATLMDARGVQTDGDAMRAKIMAAVSSGDTEGAKREISNAMAMIENGRNYALARSHDISRQYGISTEATSAQQNRPHPSPSGHSAPAPSRPTSGNTGGVQWRIKN